MRNFWVGGWLFFYLILAGSGGMVQAARQLYFGQLAAGQAGDLVLRTLFVLPGGTDTPRKVQLSFFGRDGSPLAFPFSPVWSPPNQPGLIDVRENEITIQIPPGGLLELFLEVEEKLRAGWACLEEEEEGPVQAFLQIGRGRPLPHRAGFEDSLLSETLLLPSPGLRSARFPVFLYLGFQRLETAFALVNLAAAPAEVELNLQEGSTKKLRLGPRSSLSVFFREIFDDPVIAVFPLRMTGLLEISSSAPLAVTVFRTLQGLPTAPVEVSGGEPLERFQEVDLGQIFVLSFGEGARLRGEDFQLLFHNLRQDSRCPEGATCLWEGEAEIELQVFLRGELHLLRFKRSREQQEPSTQKIGGFVVEFLKLEPLPSVGRSLQLSDYRGTFRVRRSLP